MDYFHTISVLYHKLLDYFTNVIGIIWLVSKEFERFFDLLFNHLCRTTTNMKNDFFNLKVF